MRKPPDEYSASLIAEVGHRESFLRHQLTQLLDQPFWKLADVQSFPQTPGVYLFWHNDQLWYVGRSAGSLRRRIREPHRALRQRIGQITLLGQQEVGKIRESFDIQFIETASREEAIALEHFAIALLGPRFNDGNGHLHQDRRGEGVLRMPETDL